MIRYFLLFLIPPEKDSLSVELNNVKRFSAGIKFGVPYMAVVGVQYTLPFFGYQFAPYFDYSQYSYKKKTRMQNFFFLNGGFPISFKKRVWDSILV